MTRLFTILILHFVLNLPQTAEAQDSTARNNQLSVSGYLKELANLSFSKDFADNISGNLLHHRLNLKWKIRNNITMSAEFRSRAFWGETVKTAPDFAAALTQINEQWNLRKTWINNKAFVVHTNTERLYLDLKKKKWNMRLGRQRINWGMAINWNPNDIFNAYNFLDVDYEERPGSDGIRLTRSLTGMSNLEFVFTQAGKQKAITAARYFFNRSKYDFQFTAGWYRNRYVLGAGWSGNIRQAGFRGEWQQYFAKEDFPAQTNFTMEADHVFRKGWYASAAFLYNSRGINHRLNDFSDINLNLSAENLMPARFSMIASARKTISPLSGETLSVVYAPGIKLLILMNGLNYNLCTNLDADLIWQSFFADVNSKFQAARHLVLLRLKWSY